MNLAARLGVGVSDALRAELSERLGESVTLTLELMRLTGEIPIIGNPTIEAVQVPRSLDEVITLCIADARARGLGDHGEALASWYFDSLPRARFQQLLAERHAWLLRAPVPWEELPRFRAGLTRLFALLGDEAATVMGAADVGAWLAARPTLTDLYLGTYYGRLQPMFAAHEHDLAELAREVASLDEAGRWRQIDRRLCHAMLHELLHFGAERTALYPLHLDEAIAAHLGMLLDEGVAFPPPGEDTALIGWPWYAQMGAALARVAGDRPLLLAQAGVLAWEEVLPPDLITRLEQDGFAAYRAAPAVHTLPDPTRPEPWVDIIYRMAPPAPDPARDQTMLVHALSAMCLYAEQVNGSWRVSRRAPDGPVTVDFRRGLVEAPPRTAGWEPAPLRHALPPSLRCDRAAIEVMLDADPAALEALAGTILCASR